jgi:NADP-dependent aldehyde dehydrogenase
MDLGSNWIASEPVTGTGRPIHGVDPNTGAVLEPGYLPATSDQVERACAEAWAAFDAYRELDLGKRADFLEAIADEIMALGDALVERGMAETGLPRGRLEGERGRTMGQLRLFAGIVRKGDYLGVRIDPALPDRAPLPRPDLRLRNIPLGPVAVFAASNFPLAFSVAGGDTASALAAGCPVIVKAHSAHPGLSELVASAVASAVRKCGLPRGVFSLVYGPGSEIGVRLVTDPRIKAVGFTGSRGGGMALVETAAKRREPIPVYAEMSSINPVVLLPGALAERGKSIGEAFVGALTLGVGQFCTNPGLILAIEGADLTTFFEGAGVSVEGSPAATMLSPGIHAAYASGLAALMSHAAVTTRALGAEGEGYRAQVALFETSASAFSQHHELADDVCGPAALVVRCKDLAELAGLLERLEGQLTAALHIAPSDYADAKSLLPILERKAGRILVNGFGTGVEVSHAMVHGGPSPATSDSRSTSVGGLAINRFLRPVSYQNLPQELLPTVLSDGNPMGVHRLIDGEFE